MELEDKDIDRIAERIFEKQNSVLHSLKKQSVNSGNHSLFTVKTLAKYLGVSDQWVYERVQLKQIPYIKVGKHVRFKKADIDRWLESLKVPPMDAPSSLTPLTKMPVKSKVAV